MKIFKIPYQAWLILIVAISPAPVLSEILNPHQEACLETPDSDIGSTAMACASAVQFNLSAGTPVAEEIQDRIKALKKNSELHTALRRAILDIMKLNRRAFQSERVLNRYADSRERLADQAPVFESCGLPRDSSGNPLPQYAHSFSNPDHGIKADYSESKGVLGCLNTKSGLAGVRAEPLAQHYYCTFPGNSPEIRSCFTFQTRVSSNTRSNSHKNIFMKDTATDEVRVLNNVRKEWIFAGTQQAFDEAKDTKIIPLTIINKVASYCSFDGRAARVTDSTVIPPVTYWHTSFLENYLREAGQHQDPADTNESLIMDYMDARSQAENSGNSLHDIDQIDPPRNERSRIKAPLCWINSTQRSIFQLMLSPALVIYFDRDDQESIVKEYYQCGDDSIMQEYQRSANKLNNYCPENFDAWDN